MTDQSTLNIAVLMGGPSAEAAVSRTSANQIAAALSGLGHNTTLIELDRDCAGTLLALAPDVVFPALHGPPGEDGTVQGFLEILSLPYVGSDVHGSAVAMDKAIAKEVFRRRALPVAPDIIVRPDDDLTAATTQINDRFGAGIVIKPLSQGSAIGVTPLPNGGDVAGALDKALTFGSCLVEPFVMGREITVGVLQCGDEYLIHPVIEIQTADDEWYDYDNRYTAGSSRHLMPAPLSESATAQLQQIALSAHQGLGLRDLSRADFIVTDDEQITLLEVNTLPGMTPTSLYPEGAAALGYEFPALMELLVLQAWRRGAN